MIFSATDAKISAMKPQLRQELVFFIAVISVIMTMLAMINLKRKPVLRARPTPTTLSYPSKSKTLAMDFEEIVTASTNTGCTRNNTFVKCFDPVAGCSNNPLPRRRAFVFAYDLQRDFTGHLGYVARNARALRALHSNVSLILIVPDGSQEPVGFPMTPEMERKLQEHGVSVYRRPYPAMSAGVKYYGQTLNNCCGWKEYLKLQAFALTEFDAVMFLDSEVLVMRNIDHLFRCTPTYFLTTSGPIEGLNGGFFVVRPSMELFQKTEQLLLHANFTKETGWDYQGYPPFDGEPFPGPNRVGKVFTNGAEGPQGFLYYLFYQDKPDKAKNATGYLGKPVGKQLDRCKYNYMRESEVNQRCGIDTRPFFVHKADFYGKTELAKKIQLMCERQRNFVNNLPTRPEVLGEVLPKIYDEQ